MEYYRGTSYDSKVGRMTKCGGATGITHGRKVKINKPLAVYDLSFNVKKELQRINTAKKLCTETEEGIKKRLTILDTRLRMAPCTLIINDYWTRKQDGSIYLVQ